VPEVATVHDFQSDSIHMSLKGQAVKEHSGLKVSRVNLSAKCLNGDQLRNVTGVVRDLLALYAKNSGAQAPQNP
jgi:hypothetical protein